MHVCVYLYINWCANTYVSRNSTGQYVAVCCSVLQRVAVCYSVLQSVTVCSSVLQCVVVCYSVL